jgi:hypothetical protein
MFGGNLVAAATTSSTNTTTGALVVTGGVGVSGAMFVGGALDAASLQNTPIGSTTRSSGAFTTLTSNGATTFTVGTASTSTTTGALVVTGGVGVSGAIYNGGIHQSTGNIVAAATTTSTSTTTGAIVSRGGLGVAGAAYVGGIVDIVNNTQATSTTTGALQVDGGAAIGGNLFIAGSAGRAITVTGNIVPSANLSATNNLGTDTLWWNNFYGVSTQARYADLAENYQADANYEPGTVLEFGGSAEVTVAEDGTRRVAGVVSTNPAHLMNTGLQGVNVVPIALQGRTPCKVRGKIQKGDMLISAGAGFARPDNNPQSGSIIGKALEDFHDTEGVIEVVVGRL